MDRRPRTGARCRDPGGAGGGQRGATAPDRAVDPEARGGGRSRSAGALAGAPRRKRSSAPGPEEPSCAANGSATPCTPHSPTSSSAPGRPPPCSTFFGGREWAAPAQRLIGTGLLAAGPTAWTGWAEWSQAGPRDKRVGLVHAVTNGVAIGVYAASWLARRRGRHETGARLALLGATVSGCRRLPGRPPHRGPQGRQPPPGLSQLPREHLSYRFACTTDGGLARVRHPPVRAPSAGHGGPSREQGQDVSAVSVPIRELIADVPSPGSDHRKNEPPTLLEQDLIDIRIVRADLFRHVRDIELDRAHGNTFRGR